MKYNKKVFIIVDAYTTGKFLAPYINANGYTCIHVQSRPEVISVYLATYVKENFSHNIIYEGNLQTVLDQIKQYEVKAVIPGAETGVLLADKLNEALKLSTSNGIQSSLARRDKFEMVKKLADQQINYAKSFKSNDLNEILDCTNEWDLFPLVIKPLSSSGSYGVKVCFNSDDIVEGFNDIFNQNNVFNENNIEVLLQQFLKGQEYIVNTVSYDGVHKISDIWRKFKKIENGIPINEYSELIGQDDPTYSLLEIYIYKVLNALEIKYGAGHSELILTEEGPVLIETAARLAGSIDPSAITESIGNNQVSHLISSYLNPSDFLIKTNHLPTKYVRHLFFICPHSGLAINTPNFEPILKLNSFHSLSFRFDKGSEVLKTTSLADFPGFCYLVSESKEQMQKDYDLFRHYEEKIYLQMLGVTS